MWSGVWSGGALSFFTLFYGKNAPTRTLRTHSRPVSGKSSMEVCGL